MRALIVAVKGRTDTIGIEIDFLPATKRVREDTLRSMIIAIIIRFVFERSMMLTRTQPMARISNKYEKKGKRDTRGKW